MLWCLILASHTLGAQHSKEMGNLPSPLILLILAVGLFFQGTYQISRNDFPSDFIFGAGTSAYQVEGAVSEDGRSPCIWDTFAHAGKMQDKSTADVASDQYHKYKEDVKLMSDMGLDAYRLSIAWSRLIPGGRGAVNPGGLQYYNNIINELIGNGIQPHVTLHHLDLPQVLHDEYGGWLSPKIVEDFTAYADVCFREFGDRVTHWNTINEANVFALGGYDAGTIAPGRCSSPIGDCVAGNSSVEPYIVAYHELLAHAAVAQLYREKYKAKQNGWIGINIYAFWFVPYSNSTEDVAATQRALDFMVGWFLHPLVHGDYPDSMKKNVGSRLPSLTLTQMDQVKGSVDFIGLNHYTTAYVKDQPVSPDFSERDWSIDMNARLIAVHDNSSSEFSLFDLPVKPWGLKCSLQYLKIYYSNLPVFIHENGFGTRVGLNDTERVDYLNAYLESLLGAVRNGSNVRGYFVWSLIDVFEVLLGYELRYGLYEVDFNDKALPRSPRLSAHWYSTFLKRNTTTSIKEQPSLSSQSHLIQ